MNDKIFPRNLTARAAVKIAGNPVTTRLESGVGNCFPGLEFDHRNLDRRFFPGLIFNYGTLPPTLMAVDGADPALGDTVPKDAAKYSGEVRAAFGDLVLGEWRLSSLQQGRRTIDLLALVAVPLAQQPDPALFWRLVRSLTPDPVTIVLIQTVPPPPDSSFSNAPSPPQPPSPPPPAPPATKTLTHYRRRYIDPETGVISAAYLPGELTQSLCSPWMHDFRDCACDYWASNHPDIALGSDEVLLEGDLAAADSDLATRPLDWLRADRNGRVAASTSDTANDALRLRHYQINSAWTSLAFVIDGRENSGVYLPEAETYAQPLAAPADLAKELTGLCGLEHVVMLEYLYAYFSLKSPTAFAGARSDEISFVRHELLGVIVSEMRHLRWANQLLWSLAQAGFVPPQPPALTPGLKVPTRGGERDRQLRPLTRDTLKDFVAVEQPSGKLDGAYARVVSTLRSGYPENLLQLARQIVADGMDHYNRFREIVAVIHQWSVTPGDPTPWLHPVNPATPQQAADALGLYRGILAALATAYQSGDMEDAAAILEARQKMIALNDEAERLATNGLGVPFF
jgi:hypothetical protein